MLTRLSIRDFAVVAHAELAFGAGLTVSSGEPGAGKSLLVDALGSLCGARADAGSVRHGPDGTRPAGAVPSRHALHETTQGPQTPPAGTSFAPKKVFAASDGRPSTAGATPSSAKETPSVTNETPFAVKDPPFATKETPFVMKGTPFAAKGTPCATH